MVAKTLRARWMTLAEDPEYLSAQLLTYIGNKRKLLPMIGDAIDLVTRRLGRRKLRFLDAFAGSGVVSRFMKRHASLLISNDLEEYAAVIGRCYLENRSRVDLRRLDEVRRELESQKLASDHHPEGFLARLYSPREDASIQAGERVFYTRRNARILDNLRRLVGRAPESLRDFLLAPLLTEASIHANTCGVFKGFYKDARTKVGQFGGTGKDALKRILGEIVLPLPVFSRFECDWEMHRRDANELVRELDEVDVAYFDPPYNQHPYGSNYFMLNLIARYEPPRAASSVSGIPTDWTRSDYNRRPRAAEALLDLVLHTKARFILVSSNDEGFVPLAAMRELLGRVGRVSVVESGYATFRGSRNLRGRALTVTERLFVVERS